MNVLIVNAYSAGNRGDGMIVSQMVRLFGERGCSVRVMSDDPADGGRYGVERVEPLAPVWPDDRGGPSKPTIVRRAVRDLLRPGGRAHFDWADVCVSAGGGYLYDDGSRTARLNLFRRLLPLRAARRAGVPVVLFSQSVGPFRSRLWASLVARELRRSRLVIAREPVSVEVCRRMGVDPALCDDVAFALEPEAAAEARAAPDAIGVTVMNGLPGVDTAGHRRYLTALADGLEAALGGGRRPVVVISQVAAHRSDDDTAVGRELTARLDAGGLDTTFVDLGDSSDAALSGFYGGLELVVASRLHSGILALCAGTPIVGLGYLPKTRGVLERFGLDDWVLPADGLDGAALGAMISAGLERNQELREHVQTRLPVARASAEEAVDRTLAAAQRAPWARSTSPRRSRKRSSEKRSALWRRASASQRRSASSRTPARICSGSEPSSISTPSCARAHDVAGAAAVGGQHRRSGGQRLDHRDAEVLLAHVDEAAARRRTARPAARARASRAARRWAAAPPAGCASSGPTPTIVRRRSGSSRKASATSSGRL